MPYLPTAQSFLDQSTLLISARPTTTRITTTYNIPHPSPPPTNYKPSSTRKSSKPSKDINSTTNSENEPQTTTTPPHRTRNLQPTLTLKTYDVASGVCLKYKTDKAAEVGRLVASLGRCARVMAALPLVEQEKAGDRESGMAMEGVVVEEGREGIRDGKVGQLGGQGNENPKAGEGGGKKKRKGKR